MLCLFEILFHALLLLSYLQSTALGIHVFVDKVRGSESPACVTGGESYPCANLGVALEGLTHHDQSTVWVSPGTYILNCSEGSGDYRYLWSADIAIVALFGNNSVPVPVEVDCQCDTGLTFIYARNVTIKGVEFRKCGVKHNSTSKGAVEHQFRQFYNALYFLYAQNVTLDSVNVASSVGTGMVFYASSGKNVITNCSFSSNHPKPGESGGGGLYIEFPYCAPEPSNGSQNCSLHSNVPRKYVEESLYFIETCEFLNNTAGIQNENDSTFILPHWETHLAFGRGGGLSVFFKGVSKNNRISIKNCSFRNNTALWGAGFFLEHQDASFNNIFIMESSLVDNNRCFHSSSEHNGTGGGGARVGHVFYGSKNHVNSSVTKSQMIFRNVTFSSNKAYYGGGLSLYSAREPTQSNATNTVQFCNCSWISNVARVGSGVDLSVWHPIPYGAIVSPSFTDCLFFNNSAEYTSSIGQYVGIGAFYSDFIPVNFYGRVVFKSNKPTALACIGAMLSFNSSCIGEFINNTGRNGGAVALLGYSFLQVSSNTTLRFIGNRAEFKGGAIFGQSVGEHDLISSRNCFVRYRDIEVTPWEWDATFLFENNTVSSGINSIYATSLLTCLWGGAYSSASTKREITSVFCWNRNASNPTQWIYSGNCKDEIATSPAKFEKMGSTNECTDDDVCNVVLSVIPGRSTVLPFYTIDDRRKNVTKSTVLTAQFVNDTELDGKKASLENSSLYISDNSVALYGTPNESAYLKLETISPRVISVIVRVDFAYCPPGLVDSGQECICRGNFQGLIHCDPTRYVSKLRRGAWIGLQNDAYLAGECPYCSLFTTEHTLELPQNGSDLPGNLCHSINRTGVLCGHCLPDYGPVIVSLECHPCSSSEAKYHWIYYLMTEFLPITIFFFIVVLFNIDVTSGPANSFVFFAQVVTTAFSINGDGSIPWNDITNASKVLTSLYVIPYDIWNLNFFRPYLPQFCLSPNVTTIQLLSTGYLTALYPLLLVVASSSVVWAYGRGVRPVVCLFRPVHKCFLRLRRIWNLQRSIVHALATFIILSYTKFSLVSFILLTKTPLLDDNGHPQAQVLYYDGTITYMGPDHIPYVVASVLVLVTFVALPPILLSAPSLLLLIKKLYRAVLHRDLDIPVFFSPGPRLDQFLNAFHGCYRDGTGGSATNNTIDCRWFAALYFVLRLFLFLIYASTPNWFLQYVLQQLLCLITLLIIVLFRPYKNPLFNVVDACMFTSLAAISTLSMFNFHMAATGSPLSAWPFAMQYIIIFLPLVYIVGYIIYIMWRKYGKKCCPRKKMTVQQAEDVENERFLEFADQEERYRGSCQERIIGHSGHQHTAAGGYGGGQSPTSYHQKNGYGSLEPQSASAQVNSTPRLVPLQDSMTRESSDSGP
jgi:predicted outer membrane repeat protein